MIKRHRGLIIGILSILLLTVSKSGTVKGVKAGTCIITAYGSGCKATCKVTVKAKLKYSSKKIHRGGSVTNKLYAAPGTVKWSTTKRKVATVSSKGKITAKEPGTCYIKAKCKGKTYKCKVTVYRDYPGYQYIELYDYSTYYNTFSVFVQNEGKRTLTIYSSGAYSRDCDYKKFNRKLKLAGGKSSVSIKPGKSKTVKFKVKGSTTWPDVEDQTVYFKAKYDGLKYQFRSYVSLDGCENGCDFKSNGKWKSTGRYFDDSFWYGDDEDDEDYYDEDLDEDEYYDDEP